MGAHTGLIGRSGEIFGWNPWAQFAREASVRSIFTLRAAVQPIRSEARYEVPSSQIAVMRLVLQTLVVATHNFRSHCR
jgi:hypothetical protein